MVFPYFQHVNVNSVPFSSPRTFLRRLEGYAKATTTANFRAAYVILELDESIVVVLDVQVAKRTIFQ
jgi:hypothetical protein